MRHLPRPTSFSPGVWSGPRNERGTKFAAAKERAESRERSGKITRRRIVINGVRVPWLVLPRSYSSRRSSYLISTRVRRNRGGWGCYLPTRPRNPSFRSRLIVITDADRRKRSGTRPISSPTSSSSSSPASRRSCWRGPGRREFQPSKFTTAVVILFYFILRICTFDAFNPPNFLLPLLPNFPLSREYYYPNAAPIKIIPSNFP